MKMKNPLLDNFKTNSCTDCFYKFNTFYNHLTNEMNSYRNTMDRYWKMLKDQREIIHSLREELKNAQLDRSEERRVGKECRL